MNERKVYSIIIAVLAVLLLPAVGYLLKFPVGAVILVLLFALCPCISRECQNCSCDDCVIRALIVGIVVLVGIPLLLYLTRRFRSTW